MKNKISCIIPAYNEEKMIANILKPVTRHPLIDEVIVVDDGSKDKTEAVARKFKGVKIVKHKENKGYTMALLDGMKASKNDIVMFLDADFTKVSQKNISDLILPVITGKADVSISLMKNPLIFRIIGVDFCSGQRVFNKKILDISGEKVTKWGLIVYMNKVIIKKKLRLKIVNWDVRVTTKSEKLGFFGGILDYLAMWHQLTKVMGISGWITQSYNLLRLKVKD